MFYHKAPISLFHHCLLMEADYSLNFDSLLALRHENCICSLLLCFYLSCLTLSRKISVRHSTRYSKSTRGKVEVTCLLNSVLDKNIAHTDCKTKVTCVPVSSEERTVRTSVLPSEASCVCTEWRMTLESLTLPLQEDVSVIINPVCISARLQKGSFSSDLFERIWGRKYWVTFSPCSLQDF